MNRPLPIIFSLLLLWVGAASAFAGSCCCPTESTASMERLDDACGLAAQDHWCNDRCHCSHDATQLCASLRCAGELKAFALSQFESFLPEHQISAFPIALIDRENCLQTRWSSSRQICSFHEKPIDLLLQTSSFLS